MQFITLTDPAPDTLCTATIGFFDGVHLGHRYLIEQVRHKAAKRGQASLLLTFRTHPRLVTHPDFHPRLLTTYEEKCDLLASTGADYCLTLDFTPEMARLSARDFMASILKNTLHTAVLVMGHDHRFGHASTGGFEQYADYGRELNINVIRSEAYAPSGIGTGVSSSVIRTLLDGGDVRTAARLLARPYSLTGIVVDGHRVGHQLGFPTANIRPDHPYKIVPRSGVYAVRVHDGNRHTPLNGMLNIGTRPTIDNGEEQSIEVHLLDFNGDLYGRTLTVEFVHRLRDEQRFSNREELIHRLQRDELETRALLRNPV